MYGIMKFLWLILSFQREQILLDDVLPVQEDDSLMTSHPVVVTVTTPAEITSVFDGISYSKVREILHYLQYLPVGLFLLVSA
jgi:aminopeptidase N